MEDTGSCSLKEKSARRAGTFPAGSLARLAGDAAAAREPPAQEASGYVVLPCSEQG